MQFIDVECESEQEKLCFGFDFSSGQEPSEIPVLLQYAEGSLYLYGAILTKNVSFISSNAFGSFGFLSRHCFGERILSVFVPYTSEENLTYPIYMVLCCACKEREHMSILEEIYYGNIRPSSSRASLSRRVRCDTACTLRGSSSPHRAGASGSPYNRRVLR